MQHYLMSCFCERQKKTKKKKKTKMFARACSSESTQETRCARACIVHLLHRLIHCSSWLPQLKTRMNRTLIKLRLRSPYCTNPARQASMLNAVSLCDCSDAVETRACMSAFLKVSSEPWNLDHELKRCTPALPCQHFVMSP